MEVFNIKFVGEVEKHPELYNYTIQEYSRKDCIDRAWNEVAKEFNLSAAECKEKWRNLRSTLVKHLKPKPSGSGVIKKKPYYLAEAMQFAIPFIKVAGNNSGNLSTTTHELLTEETESLEEKLSEDLSTSILSPNEEHSLPSIPSPKLGPIKSYECLGSSTQPECMVKGKRSRSIRRKDEKQSDAEKAFADYFTAKKEKFCAPIHSAPQVDKKDEGIKSFLISQVPDLTLMNDCQLRAFKRRSLALIDEIMGTLTQSYQPIVLQSYPSTNATKDGKPIGLTAQSCQHSTRQHDQTMPTKITEHLLTCEDRELTDM